MQELIPLCTLVKGILLCTLVKGVHKGMGLAEQKAVTWAYLTVFEDNNGALIWQMFPKLSLTIGTMQSNIISF
jgi:hypothetical protein